MGYKMVKLFLITHSLLGSSFFYAVKIFITVAAYITCILRNQKSPKCHLRLQLKTKLGVREDSYGVS